MSIYQKLEFETESDGSVSDHISKQALLKLGFINTDEIKFIGYCMSFNLSTIVPLRVIGLGLNCRMYPVYNQPGKYLIRYMRVGTRDYLSEDSVSPIIYEPEQILEALQTVLKLVERTKAALPESTTTDPLGDDRYRLVNDSWQYKGKPCEMTTINFSDDTIYFVGLNPDTENALIFIQNSKFGLN
jgi:hypothetical protein